MIPMQLEFTFTPKRSRKVRFGYDLSRWDKECGRQPYSPRECRRRLLSIIVPERYTGFSIIVRDTKMKPQPVAHMLDFLVQYGKLEKHELYCGPYTTPDRLECPKMSPEKDEPKQYFGFEWGYRKK